MSSSSHIILPSQPRIVSEVAHKGIYEIDGLAPGYGYTLGNSLRRIILSSLPGAAIISVKIDGVDHEFSTIDGIREDVINMLLNLKQVRFKITGTDMQQVTLQVKGAHVVTAKDITTNGQVEVLNPDQYICELTDKNAQLHMEITIAYGLGFMPKEEIQKEKVEIGTIALDAFFSPIRRASYEVENMRVGDNTNHNRLRMIIETDGTVLPREALEKSIGIMIEQLKAIVGFTDTQEEMVSTPVIEDAADKVVVEEEKTDFLKTRIEDAALSTRTINALTNANIRTVGGIARKKAEDLLGIEGIGEKGIHEIRSLLSEHGIELK